MTVETSNNPWLYDELMKTCLKKSMESWNSVSRFPVSGYRLVLLLIATTISIHNILKFRSSNNLVGGIATDVSKNFSSFTIGAPDTEICTIQRIDTMNNKSTTPENISMSKEEKEIYDENGVDVLNYYHVCRSYDKMAGFRCRGKDYDEFADRLERMIRFKHFCWSNHHITSNGTKLSHNSFNIWWGKRSSPFPPKSTILAIGNSHTRQFLQSMICQYPTIQYINLESGSTNLMDRGSHYFVEFENNAKLQMVINDGLFYSKNWFRYLEGVTRTLADVAEGQQSKSSLRDTFDMLIVGDFNHFATSHNTTFKTAMIEQAEFLEDVDFQTIQPPKLFDIAQHYSGPIIKFSNFRFNKARRQYRQTLRNQPTRSNIRLVDGRRYESEIGHCLTNDWKGKVGMCQRNITASAHRCIGPRGGHPDLTSWDVIEEVYDLFSISNV